MAPHGETIVSSYSSPTTFPKPPRLSKDLLPGGGGGGGLHRTVSDITFELAKESAAAAAAVDQSLPPISEVEDARCECCNMSEECTPEYISGVRERFSGKWICGLCAEAVKEEMEREGGKKKQEDALSSHMSACVRFNKLGRNFPVLCQAEAMREILKKGAVEGRLRAKSMSPRDKKGGGIARSSSCMPAITREMNDLKIAH